MSTLKTTNIAHPSSASNNIVLDSSGNAAIQAGTAAAPSVYFSGDSNTGIYSPGADSVAITTGGSARLTVDSSGRALVGTSSTSGNATLHVNKGSVAGTDAGGLLLTNMAAMSSTGAGDDLGYINFGASTTGGVASYDAARILCEADATWGTNDYPSRLVFSVTPDGSASPVEAMRITQNRETRLAYNPVANVTTTAETNGGTDGIILGAASGSFVQFAKQSGAVGSFNRQVDDGTIVSLRQAGTEEGTISVSGNTVSYNQFLGSHWAALADWSRPEIKLGTILETINELMDWKYTIIEVDNEQKKICYNGTAAPGDTVSVEYEGETYEGIVELESDPEFNKAVKVKVNETAASKAVYGVFVGWNNDSSLDGGTWNDMYVGAVGNYVIRMAAGQEPEIGDLVEADGAGCAVVQDDDIIRTKTVAKITSTIPQVTYDDGSFLVSCVLYCG